MFYGRGGISGRLGLSRSLLVATAIVGTMASGAYAQTPPAGGANIPAGQQQQPGANQGTGQGGTQATAPDGTQQLSGVAAVIEANLTQPGQICAACTPLIMADPAAAAELIAAAKKHPELAEMLAQCLSKLQQSMSATNPEGAQKVAALVANAPPAFQAAYAVALAPGGGDGGGGGGDGGGGGGAGGGGGGSSGGGLGGGGGGGGGGGLTGTGGSFSTAGGPLTDASPND